MTLLLTGVTGTLGSDLKKLFPEAISPPHSEFDICDSPKLMNSLRIIILTWSFILQH